MPRVLPSTQSRRENLVRQRSASGPSAAERARVGRRVSKALTPRRCTSIGKARIALPATGSTILPRDGAPRSPLVQNDDAQRSPRRRALVAPGCPDRDLLMRAHTRHKFFGQDGAAALRVVSGGRAAAAPPTDKLLTRNPVGGTPKTTFCRELILEGLWSGRRGSNPRPSAWEALLIS